MFSHSYISLLKPGRFKHSSMRIAQSRGSVVNARDHSVSKCSVKHLKDRIISSPSDSVNSITDTVPDKDKTCYPSSGVNSRTCSVSSIALMLPRVTDTLCSGAIGIEQHLDDGCKDLLRSLSTSMLTCYNWPENVKWTAFTRHGAGLRSLSHEEQQKLHFAMSAAPQSQRMKITKRPLEGVLNR